MWRARYKSVTQDLKDLTTVKIEIEYYDRPNDRPNFFETYVTRIDASLDDIIEKVLARLEDLNKFEMALERLRALIGMDVMKPKAATLGLKLGTPVFKKPPVVNR
jgi:hypothetical protein